jgi:hypothetical protein
LYDTVLFAREDPVVTGILLAWILFVTAMAGLVARDDAVVVVRSPVDLSCAPIALRIPSGTEA